MKTIICDLDGTLANIDHRLHFITGEKKDWDGFFGAVAKDKPNMWCVELLKGMMTRDTEIIFVSGRNASAFIATRAWLDALGFNGIQLFMRPEDNRQPDFELKEHFYNEALKDKDILFVIEDRKQVVDMWRSKGIVVLQCDPGEF